MSKKIDRCIERDDGFCCDCFWFEGINDVDAATCRRYPPVPFQKEWSFPTVRPDDWCGEFIRESMVASVRGKAV